MTNYKNNSGKNSNNSTGADGCSSFPPSRTPSAPVCFLCLGEGYIERETEYFPYEVIAVSERCRMCDGSGLIYPRDLYECQGHGCGVLVTGETLIAMKEGDTPCHCKAPARRFARADPADFLYPNTTDEHAEAVWTLEDLIERTGE